MKVGKYNASARGEWRRRLSGREIEGERERERDILERERERHILLTIKYLTEGW